MIETPADDVLDRTAESAGPAAQASKDAAKDASAEAVPPPENPFEGHADGAGLDDAQPRAHGLARLGGWLRRAWQFFIAQSFSSLTRRIVSLNVAGLLALSIGIIFLSQFRAGLIDARVQSLLVQGEIIAGAIASSATVETNTITISPERLMDLPAGESYGPADDGLSVIDFSINPERVAPVLSNLVSPTK